MSFQSFSIEDIQDFFCRVLCFMLKLLGEWTNVTRPDSVDLGRFSCALKECELCGFKLFEGVRFLYDREELQEFH